MGFYAKSFVFDNVPSEMYGLLISTKDGAEGSTDASSDVEIVTQEIFRRPAPYFYGTTQRPVLSFEVEVYTPYGEISSVDASAIQSWLFGHNQYKKLQIVQPDMEDYYYSCILTSPKVNRVGNIIRGFTFTVVCDSPFAWGNLVTTRYTQSNRNYRIFNMSDNNYYTFPIVKIKLNGTAGSFNLTNITDNNKTMSFSGLLAGDTVIIDTDLQIITANLTPNILNTMNSPIYFFRLLKGHNNIFVEGNFSWFEISYRPMKRIV